MAEADPEEQAIVQAERANKIEHAERQRKKREQMKLDRRRGAAAQLNRACTRIAQVGLAAW
eukprot:1352833-Prymnesium_polylepis.1